MEFKTSGVCSSEIHIDVQDHIIKHVDFVGGCDGNLQAISHLVEGMRIEDAIPKLAGIHCGPKATSCPDQLARALKQMVNH